MPPGPSTHADPPEFPAHGARARQWNRFERQLHDWLGTPHGRFASWSAERVVAGDPPFCAQVARPEHQPVAARQF